MAEAHQATHYSSSNIHQHTEINHDQETLELVLSSGGHSWKIKSANRIKNFIYPARIEILYVTVGIAIALYFSEMPFGFIEMKSSSSIIFDIFACIFIGLILFAIICVCMKVTMMLLLRYQGYMYETRGRKVSLKTQIWAILMKSFLKFNPPQLYSFQSLLPRLSVPPLKDTINRYLRSVRPIYDDETYNRIAQEAQDFQNGIGKKLQRYLILKSWWATNYVSDWWEEFIYLKSSTPLMVNSNVFSSDHISRDTTIQSARAANVCYLFLQFRKSIDDQTLKPIMANNLVPLCSTQYQRLFNTTRIPGIDGDKLIHFETSDHIAVLHKGCYYKVTICVNGRLLKPREIQYQFEQIINSNNQTSHGEKYLASLTAWERTKWATTRNKYFSNGINKKSLDIIESAAFVLNLHDGPYIMELENLEQPEVLTYYCTQNFYGRIYDFWFDKSFNICFGTNGRMAFNAEHAWGDAPAVSRMLEECMVYDIKSYDAHGNIKGTMEIKPPLPVRLNWDFSDQNLINTIDEAYGDGLKLISDLDYQCVVHDAFGKGLMKACKLSPDAFIQMALQLAYFRDFGRFSLTYEASMTRLFKDGRTETVRSCTIESCAWVKSMEDPKTSIQERVKLLQEACKRHQKGYLEAMTGKGVDRHLFCLYVVSKYLEIDSPFLKEVLSEPWRLSTSQTPHGQSDFVDLKKYPQLKGCAGGFGPVSKDGYGISYIISGEDRIYFHVSSFKSSPVTNTDRFGKRIRKALWDIKELVEKFNSEQGDKRNGHK
ncbi:hypothetical protein PVAND_016721 [Polypedilum vanderplanki]|uniref:Carnitine O-palmitoyltransferase n=1 Tax=Polypedilum vanderplanki TaxID=319348 RepID=A0A9J6BH06_POLVA|nr:hypothetical protein PVAND_016721 [Polypedilum vanderplanki]